MVSLVDPLKIRSLVVRNRLISAPIRSRKASRDGMVKEEILKHYIDLSGCVGTVIVEHAYVQENGRLSPQLGIHDDVFIPGLSILASSIKSEGSAAVLQISHGGSHCSVKILGGAPLAPSAIRNPKSVESTTPREMTIKEIQDLIQAFSDAAKRAVTSGFDGIEIHCAHGFLLGEFISPLTNNRRDDYGGNFKNRIRLPVQVTEAVRKAVGENYPLFCRFPATDLLPGGLELDDSVEMGKKMISAGIDVLDVSGGIGGIEPPGPKKQGFFIPEAETIKKATGAIVVGVGGIVDGEFADEAIRKGKVDLIAVGRAMIRDPDWCSKTLTRLKKHFRH